MNRNKKLSNLIKQANAEEDARVYFDYAWKESAERKRKRKQERAKRRANRRK